MKIDILKVQGDVVIHKQYEHKDGRNYIRVKKRPLWTMNKRTLSGQFLSDDVFGV